MSILNWRKEDSVAIITMTNGENRNNPDFVATILNVLDEIEKDETISSVIITSSDDKNWSQGIDLQWIMTAYGNKDFQAIKDFMYGLNKIYMRVLLYPVPVIAALNGHAFGAGTILACACDFRFMRSDRGFFCFPEIDINIPFLPGMQAIIRKAFPYYKLEEAVLTGKRYGAIELEAHHVITKASDNIEALMSDTLAFAKTLNKKRPIFGEMKRRFNKRLIDAIEKEDPYYIDSLKLFM
jgi:enoyl-CoA hydratase/carnithine racemase